PDQAPASLTQRRSRRVQHHTAVGFPKMGVLEAMKGPIGVAFLTMISVLSIVVVVALCRKLCCKPAVNYTMVNHGLDEEEMAFKKSMEAQNGDDIDELFNFSGQDELEFDTNDLDNLEMLQTYRSNLGETPGSPGRAETGLGKDDRNGVGGAVGRSNG
ncbi:unnamed protein product, partial [Laminaria digitata]